LRRLLRWLAEEHGASPRLASQLPKVESPDPRNNIVTDAERSAIMAAAKPHLKCWLLMCSDLAIRSGTAAVMAPQNYDPVAKTLTFQTKKGRNMCLPVTGELDALLRPLAMADSATPFVCLLHPLGRIATVSLRLGLRKLRAEVGIVRRFTPHDLRRTTAVKVYTNTRDLRAVQAILGHRTLTSTLHYLDHRNTPVSIGNLELAKLNPTTEVVQ
jgi:integrase